MNDNKIKIIIVIVILLSVAGFYQYILFLDIKKEQMRQAEYSRLAKDIKKEVKSLIVQKQKATTAIALAVVNHKELAELIKKGRIPRNYFKPLITELKKNTNYKNIWIQVINKNMLSIHRSWSRRWGDRVRTTRKDIKKVFKTKQVVYDVNVDKYTLSIRALVPVFDKKRVVGVLEVISHFNSIANILAKEDIKLLVVLDKNYKKVVQYPYTKMFIDDYYVANFNVDKQLLHSLNKEKIQEYISKEYMLDDKHFITSFPITSLENKPIAYALMFKDKEAISYVKLDFLIFKWMAVGAVLLLFVVILFDVYLFRRLKKQKSYYKNIIDSSTNVVIVYDGKKIIEANKIFFEFISGYKTIEKFNAAHKCLCDFFVKEEGYLYKTMDSHTWLEYLLEHKRKQHKVKINHNDTIYYFVVSASVIDEENHLYTIIFTDITNEEHYKHELENISVIDPLTNIGNRRYFNKHLAKEISLAKRYNIPVSLIMFDIDFFKKINDNHGHDVGDEVLIEYTRLIKENLRENDIFCRIGGEEFMIILPYVTKQEAAQVAEKLRSVVENHKKILPITMSFGVSEYINTEEIKSLLKRVDEAVYDSKENGRNKVSVR